MGKSCSALKNKKFLVPFILLLIIIFIFVCYLLESRFFLIGKTIFPVYRFLNNAGIENALQTNPGNTISTGGMQNGAASDKNTSEAALQPADAQAIDTIVYCDYYTWHNKARWERGYSEEPVLGFYDSLDPEVISTHIEWASEYGIDVFKIEYYPQLDDSMLGGIFASPSGDVSLCLMYDSRLRFENVGYPKPPYDFDDPVISDTFKNDILHIAENYFSRQNYFKIAGRPVLWLYVARDFTGSYTKVIEDVREQLGKKGYDIYLVGDAVFWNYRLPLIRAFDAVSCYSAYGGRPQNSAAFADRLKFLYMVWEISARFFGKDFIPSAIPGYDDRCLEAERPSLPVLSGTADDFNYQLNIIKAFLDPVNISPQITQVSIATFNEHQEGTSVEPSLPWGIERIKQITEIFGSN